MKRILVFGISSNFGGVESVIFNYGSRLRNNDYVLDYLLINTIPSFLKEYITENSKVFVVPDIIENYFGYRQGIKKVLEENKYEALWYNVNSLNDITLLKLAKKIPIRILHAHNSRYMGRKWMYFLHLIHKKQISKYTTHYIACSKVAGEFMFPNKIIRDKKFTILRNAIDLSKYTLDRECREQLRKKYKLENTFVIGHVGRFMVQKNHEFIIDIFVEILKKKIDARLLLIGDGELKGSIQKKVENYNITDKVIFMGAISNVNEIYQVMDTFLLPSFYEGLPLVGVEAQSVGLPCFFSDTISEELAITELAKFISLNNSAEEWASEILAVTQNIKHKNYFYEIQRAGFDIDKNVQNFIKIIEV